MLCAIREHNENEKIPQKAVDFVQSLRYGVSIERTEGTMTREQALEVAKKNHAAHCAADIANLFKGGPTFDAQAEYGYRHGWYTVGEYSFCPEEITGRPYDGEQGGWAYL